MQKKFDLKSKRILVALSVFMVCVLAMSVLTACGGRNTAYRGVYVLFFPGGDMVDVTTLYAGTTIEISGGKVTLVMLGDTKVFNYSVMEEEDEEDNWWLAEINEANVRITLFIFPSNGGAGRDISYMQTDLTDGDNNKLIIMDFEHDSGNLFTLNRAQEISGTGHITFDLKAGGVADIERFIFGQTVAPVKTTGSYSVKNDTIRVYDDKKVLIFVGTIVDNDKIEVNLQTPANASFATLVQGAGVEIVDNILTIHKAVVGEE